MNKINVKFIAQSAIIAALYVALTWIFYPISYGNIQFRISEVLVLLAVLNPKYSLALIIGCLVSNSFSSLGLLDVVFGGIATTLSIICMTRCKKLWLASIFPVLFNAFIVAFELELLEISTFWLNVLSVGIGEFVVLYFLGIPLMYVLAKNEAMVDLLELKVDSIFDIRIKTSNLVSIIIGIVGIIIFIAYPIYYVNEEVNTLLSMINDNIWIIALIILPILFSIVSFFNNKIIRIVLSCTILISLLVLYVIIGIMYPNTLINPYYYGYYLYLGLIGLLIFKQIKNEN